MRILHSPLLRHWRQRRAFLFSLWSPHPGFYANSSESSTLENTAPQSENWRNTSILSKRVNMWSRSVFWEVYLCLEVVQSSPPHPPCTHTHIYTQPQSTHFSLSNNLNVITYYNIRNGTRFTFNGFLKNSCTTSKVHQVNKSFYGREAG